MQVWFERGTGCWQLPILWSVLRGRRVVVFDFRFDGGLQKARWIRRWVRSGRIERMYVPSSSAAGEAAIDGAERLFGSWAAHPLVRSAAGLFGAGEVAPVIKKALLEDLFRYEFMRGELLRRAASLRGEPVVMASGRYWQWAGLHRSLDAPARRPWWVAVAAGSLASRLATTWSMAGAVAAHAVCLAVGRRVHRRQERPRVFDYAYAIDQPFQTKFQGSRRFDFILDGERIRCDNTVFLVHPEADGAWAGAAEAQGYAIVRTAGWPDIRRPWRHLRQPNRRADIRAALRVVDAWLRHPAAPEWLSTAVGRGVLTELTRAGLLESVAFQHYLYMNQDQTAQQWLNALLRRWGRQSWEFAFSVGGGYLYAGGGAFGCRQWMWGFGNPDHFVASSAAMASFVREHGRGLSAYHPVGDIWSESVRVAEANRPALRERWFGREIGESPVMAWFDTTFVEAENSPSTLSEAVAWYGHLERLLEELPAVRVIVKPSKPAAFLAGADARFGHPLGRDLLEILARLRGHRRVRVVPDDADPAEVIASADLTVTFCFSSPTADAWGAGRRALWSEPGARWRTTPLGDEARLVSHGYEELRAAVRALLWETDDASLRQLLEARVKGLVDDHLDGRGLSRFRDLLAGACGGVAPASTAETRAEPALAEMRDA